MDYQKIRYFLFTQSYIASEIVKKLRAKYRIKRNMTYPGWIKRIEKDHMDLLIKKQNEWKRILHREIPFNFEFIWLAVQDIEKELTPDIGKIAKILAIDEDLFRVLMLYDNVPKKLYPPQRIFYANELSPISDEGMYIKVDDRLTYPEMLKYFSEAKNRLKSFPRNKNKIIKDKHRKDIGPGDEDKIQYFLQIEKEIIQLAKEKRKYKNPDEEASRSIVIDAIDQVAGDITDTEADKRKISEQKAGLLFTAWKKRLTTYYYEITSRYNLPTSQDLISLLGLISN